MDINSLLSGINCSCGRRHECDIEAVVIEKGAIKKLSDLCKRYKKILIVADENTYGAAGERVVSSLCEKEILRVIFPASPLLIPDEVAIDKITSALSDADLILGIGSGVIQDLCKYVSKFSSVPYMVVATAPSMDGYASTGAAMILGGMKETVSAGLPRAIILDTEILKDAPLEMIKAGYGDIIGKYSCLSDWKISNIINGEYLCDYIYNTTYEMIEKTLSVADGILSRDEESIGILSEALIVVGIMMSFAGSSRPASGSEHHLSHFFEIVGIVKGEEYFSHGIDVAYSTVVTSMIRDLVLSADFDKEIYRPDPKKYESRLRELYGQVAEGCIALQERLGSYKTDRSEIYKAKEKEIKAALEKVPSAERIEALLEKVGLNIKDFYSLYGKEKILGACAYAKDLKDRYTVLWLAYDLGLLEK
jgi:glycerol-1-phosphate dehydrogenase [NAD(P)+]